MSRTDSILARFRATVQQRGDSAALWREVDGEFRAISYAELYESVCCLASGLVRNGLEPGDRVVHISENRWEWIVTDLALQACGAIHVPAHAPLSGAQIAWQTQRTKAAMIIVSGEVQARKLRGRNLPADLPLLTYDPFPAEADASTPILWNQRMQEGGWEHGDQLVTQRIAQIQPNDLLTILFTSGTTGEGKGVMLSQNNLVSNAWGAQQYLGPDATDRRLTFLPLSHIFARTCDLYISLLVGTPIALATSRESVLADCQRIQPTTMNGVPYFFGKVRDGLLAAGRASPEGLAYAFGGSMRLICSGGAPLPDDVFDFYQQQGLPILQGYGLSETSPVISVSSVQQNRRGASGLAIPDVDVRITDDGEIATRGPHVMLGYYEDPDATNDAIRDGWFLTGDLGRLDDDGFLYITGRRKEIIVLSSGKNVSPIGIEQLLTQSPLIDQAMVVGEARSFLCAILVVNSQALRDALNDAAQSNEDRDDASLLLREDAQRVMQSEVDARLAELSHHEQVRKLCLRIQPFSVESGELTPKLSLRRPVVESRHEGEIAQIYAPHSGSQP